MKTNEIISQFQHHVIPNYTRLPIALVRGAGSKVWDADGKEYLDLFPGWGVAGLGHCHPKVSAAIAAQAKKLIHVANNFYIEEQGRFAEMLSTRADGQLCFFCNSGAEAVEGALKLARLHSEGRYKVITFEESFHGRTFGAAAATGQPSYREGFLPVVPGFSHARLNDLDSVQALLDDETCAIMVEPVQGEGGVRPCTKEFLQQLRALCDEKNLVLIFDEVQTTPVRLGTWFGYQHFGVTPDILTSAKALAGGAPMGVIMATPDLAKSLIPGKHASTFGGHSLGCAAGIAAIEAIEEEGLLERVGPLGAVIDEQVKALTDACDVVSEYRRVGLMVGIELQMPGAGIVSDCIEKGLLINCAHGTVLRLLPAFTVSDDEIVRGFEILTGAVRRALADA